MVDQSAPTGKKIIDRLERGQLPQMVDWLNPAVLGMVAIRTIISTTIGAYADQRPMQEAIDGERNADRLARRHDYSRPDDNLPGKIFPPDVDPDVTYFKVWGASASDVWIVGETAPALAGFMQTVSGAKLVGEASSSATLQTRTGAIVLAQPPTFERAFGVAAPHPDDGPHLAAFTVACQTLGELADLPRNGDRQVLAPAKNFGTAIGFVEASKR